MFFAFWFIALMCILGFSIASLYYDVLDRKGRFRWYHVPAVLFGITVVGSVAYAMFVWPVLQMFDALK